MRKLFEFLYWGRWIFGRTSTCNKYRISLAIYFPLDFNNLRRDGGKWAEEWSASPGRACRGLGESRRRLPKRHFSMRCLKRMKESRGGGGCSFSSYAGGGMTAEKSRRASGDGRKRGTWAVAVVVRKWGYEGGTSEEKVDKEEEEDKSDYRLCIRS